MYLGLHEQHIQTPDMTCLLPQAVATWGRFCSPNCPDKVHPRTRHGLTSGYKLPHALGLLQEESDRDNPPLALYSLVSIRGRVHTTAWLALGQLRCTISCPALAQCCSHPAPVRSYSWQNPPCPSVNRSPLPTEEGPAYHSCSAAFNNFHLCLGYWQVLPVQSKKSSSFHHPQRSFHFKNNAFQCQLGQQLLLED